MTDSRLRMERCRMDKSPARLAIVLLDRGNRGQVKPAGGMLRRRKVEHAHGDWMERSR